MSTATPPAAQAALASRTDTHDAQPTEQTPTEARASDAARTSDAGNGKHRLQTETAEIYDALADPGRPIVWANPVPFEPGRVEFGDAYRERGLFRFGDCDTDEAKRSMLLMNWHRLQRPLVVETSQSLYSCRIIGLGAKYLKVVKLGDIFTIEIEWEDLERIAIREPVADEPREITKTSGRHSDAVAKATTGPAGAATESTADPSSGGTVATIQVPIKQLTGPAKEISDKLDRFQTEAFRLSRIAQSLVTIDGDCDAECFPEAEQTKAQSEDISAAELSTMLANHLEALSTGLERLGHDMYHDLASPDADGDSDGS